jgi:hypothetical protein
MLCNNYLFLDLIKDPRYIHIVWPLVDLSDERHGAFRRLVYLTENSDRRSLVVYQKEMYNDKTKTHREDVCFLPSFTNR